MVETIQIQLEPVCNSAASGLDVAREISKLLAENREVCLNAQEVERMTPSFANAMVMTVLAEYPQEDFASRVLLDTSNQFVLQQVVAAVSRYNRGIRLSSQRPAMTA
jgi:hypothetical protein